MKLERVSLVEGPSWPTGDVVDERVVGGETAGTGSRVGVSSNGGVISGHFASTFSWVFCQGGVWMAMEVWTW